MQLEFEALNLPPLNACVIGGRKWEVGGRSYKLAGVCSLKKGSKWEVGLKNRWEVGLVGSRLSNSLQ